MDALHWATVGACAITAAGIGSMAWLVWWWEGRAHCRTPRASNFTSRLTSSATARCAHSVSLN